LYGLFVKKIALRGYWGQPLQTIPQMQVLHQIQQLRGFSSLPHPFVAVVHVPA
jgi:hypothetical protein